MTTAHPASPERGFDIETDPDPETTDQVYDKDRKLMFLPMPKREIDPEEGIRWLGEDLPCWLQALVVGLRMEKEDEPLDKDLQSAFALLAIDITNAIHACTWAARKKETVVLDLEERDCIDFNDWTTVLSRLVAARSLYDGEGPRDWAFEELADALVHRLNQKPKAESEAEPEEDDEKPIEERGDRSTEEVTVSEEGQREQADAPQEHRQVTGLQLLNPDDFHTLDQIREFVTGKRYVALMDLVRCALVSSGDSAPHEIEDARQIAWYLVEDLECLSKVAAGRVEVNLKSSPNDAPSEEPRNTVRELMMLERVLHRHEIDAGPGDLEPLNAVSDLICYWRAKEADRAR